MKVDAKLLTKLWKHSMQSYMQDKICYGTPVLIRGSSAPSLLSSAAPWQDILIVEQHRLAAQRWHESVARDYLVGMTMSAPGQLEWRTKNSNQNRTCGLSAGRGLFTINTPVWWRQAQDADVVFAALDSVFVERVTHAISDLDPKNLTRTVAFTDPGVESILLALRAELFDDCPGGRLYGECLATALVARLVWLSAKTSRCSSYGGLPPARLRRILDYIDTNLTGDMSIDRLAELVRMSPRQFGRLFLKSTGYTPHQYVLSKRISASKSLLLDDQLSLAEISYVLGFPSQAHFTTTFRKKVGVTPSAFRKVRSSN
jgi:AraC family transcriptional regulator